MTYYDSKFTFTELYNMPVYLRRYYENKLIQIRKEENDETPQKRALDKLKIERYCCRTLMLGTVELIRELH